MEAEARLLLAMGGVAMTLESGKATAMARPVDVYLGFELYEEEEGILYIARPQGWAEGEREALEATDLPLLRKRIWRWWHNLPD